MLCNVTVDWEYCDGAINFWSSYGKGTKEYKDGGYDEEDTDKCFADDIMAGNDEEKQDHLLGGLDTNYDQSGGIVIEHFDIGDIVY